MEVNLIDRHAVDAAFRVRNGGVDGQYVFAHGLRNIQMRDQMPNFMQAGVVMVLMIVPVFMLMFVRVRGQFLRAVDGHAHVRSRDATFDGRLRQNADARQAERVHFCEERLAVGQKLIQRAHQHVARRAHGAVQIDGFHSAPPM